MTKKDKLTAKQKKVYIKQLFRNYKKMTRDLESKLEELDIHVEHSKNHIKLLYNGQIFSCPCTASDYRSGMNLASIVCRAI